MALFLFGALVVWTQPQPVEEEPEQLPVVYDTPAEPQVPLYMQTDERWGGLPYAGADLATSGCGLTCAAMAWERLSGETCTPPMLLNLVGNDYVQDGQNYMPGFCEWMAQQDPKLDYTVLHEDGREYGGHVVLITENLYGHITIHDPCEAYPVALDYDEFNAVAWDYFISIGRG